MFRNQPRQFNERPQVGFPQFSDQSTYAGYSSGSNVAPGQQMPPQQRQQTFPQTQGQQMPPQQRQQTFPQTQGQQMPPQQRQQTSPQTQGQQSPPLQRQQTSPQTQGQQSPPQQRQQTSPQTQGQQSPPQQRQQTSPQAQGQQTQQQQEYSSQENFAGDDSDFSYTGQIARADGPGKLIDFTDRLVLAQPEDFAHIHGIGGAKHSPRSTISVAICDYSGENGAQSKSYTVRFGLDVRDVDLLYTAAMDACLPGLLHPNNCKYQPGVPYFSYSREKNQGAYKRNSDGTAPVKKIEIAFSPLAKDGSQAKYPWYICITNFDAPVKIQRNGNITHASQYAKNIVRGFINLSRDDFRSCMTSVKHYVDLWEQVMASEMIAQGIVRRNQIRADRARNN